jgi:hypothetical protein
MLFGSTVVPTLPIFYNIDEAYVVLRQTFGAYYAINALLNKIEEIQEIKEAIFRRVLSWFIPSVSLALITSVSIGWLIVTSTYSPKLAEAFSVLAMVSLAITVLAILMRGLSIYTLFWTPWITLGADTLFDTFFVRIRILKVPEGGSSVAKPISPSLPPGWRSRAVSQLRHSQICFDSNAIAAAIDWIRCNGAPSRAKS